MGASTYTVLITRTGDGAVSGASLITATPHRKENAVNEFIEDLVQELLAELAEPRTFEDLLAAVTF
jgi:hypothetical protein